MTTEELRALDRRVAELRGWAWHEAVCVYGHRDFVLLSQHDPTVRLSWCHDVELGQWGHDPDLSAVPCYSTDPAASRVLLDEMAGAGDIEFEVHRGGRAEIMFWREPYGPWRHGDAPSLDAAICLAWCAWKEAQA